MNHRATPLTEAPPLEQVQEALAHVEGSIAFASSARHRLLLRHLVGRALAGDLAALKESVIAIEVFGRPSDRFDPRTDTIVRVEVRRLRQRLADYYRDEGRLARLQIVLPIGSYVPQWLPRTPLPQQASRRARDLCERGEHYPRQPLSAPTLRAAIERFDAALKQSPHWAPAHVGRGRAWLNLATGWYEPPGPAAKEAGAALDSALQLEPGHPVALALRAAIASQFDRDWPRARTLFRRAAEFAPLEAFVHSAYGAHLTKQGLFDEAEHALLRSRQLDPQYVNTRMHMINLRIGQRRLDDAETELDALRDIAGVSIATLGLQGVLALCRGDTASAVASYRAAWEQLPDLPACGMALAAALAADGRVDEADSLHAQVLTRVPVGCLSPYLLALFERWRGRPEQAFDWLEATLAERDPQAIQIPDEPGFDVLHVDPRWPALARRSRQP